MTSDVLPEGMVIDGTEYQFLEIAPGQFSYKTNEVNTQPGDGGVAKPYPVRMEGGFGASKRYSTPAGGQTAPSHHDFAKNFDVRYAPLHHAAPIQQFTDLAQQGAQQVGFQFGGTVRGQLGGGQGGIGGGQLGGGGLLTTPWAISEFGPYCYVTAGNKTYTVDPTQDPPTLVETRNHPATARGFSSDVFDNQLVVALGDDTDMEIATAVTGTPNSTAWTIAQGVRRSAVRTGKAGRFFSSRNNLVYNVLAGQNPATLANYLPSAGEVVTDETHPVRALEEFLRGITAGTDVTVRVFDPDAGFQSRALIAPNKLSPSEFDGRSLITHGTRLLFATARAVWMFEGGSPPIECGPELVEQNESPYIGGEAGVPDRAGNWVIWPYYFPATGDSVIFWVRFRRDGEEGIGPLVWHDFIYVQGREIRAVKFWGGTAAVKPKLLFGAGTPAVPAQLGVIGLGRGGAPDVFDTDAEPALSATIESASDDMGLPTTKKDVERFEYPEIVNADASNYIVCAAKADSGSFVNLVKAQTGSDQERVNSDGFQTVFAPTGTSIDGIRLKLRFTITQAASASFLLWLGWGMVYASERPITAEQVETLLITEELRDIEDAEEQADRLRALVGGKKVLFQGGPGDVDFYGKIVEAQGITVDIEQEGARTSVAAIRLVWRVVATAQ